MKYFVTIFIKNNGGIYWELPVFNKIGHISIF